MRRTLPLVSAVARAQVALGEAFDRQRFHDFVLAQGLLPPRLLEKAVIEQFVAGESKRSSGLGSHCLEPVQQVQRVACRYHVDIELVEQLQYRRRCGEQGQLRLG